MAPRRALWPRAEHAGLLLGVLLAGLLLGAWQAGLAGGVARAHGAPRLSGYLSPADPAPAYATVAGAPGAGPVSVPLPPPAAPAPSLDAGTVVGPPTLSAAAIDAILAGYGSPAQGQGAVFVQLGRQFGIDPAFALAFYVHESRCGTRGVARFTHGIGNIRWTPGYASYAGYRSYPTFAAGIADWFQLIRTLYVDGWGLRTVAAIIPRYAPAADGNDVPAYVADVRALVAGWRADAGSEVGG